MKIQVWIRFCLKFCQISEGEKVAGRNLAENSELFGRTYADFICQQEMVSFITHPALEKTEWWRDIR